MIVGKLIDGKNKLVQNVKYIREKSFFNAWIRARDFQKYFFVCMLKRKLPTLIF